ncbi:MAG: Na+/H+ antiporter [Acidobacteria bacterium]|nr:Na+/H+ antiporter [Acidobacteriota bacterium]
MEQLTIILILLFAVALSRVTSLVSRIPLPLLQILFGIILGQFHLHRGLDPSVFLLLFIAPLLFVEAYRFPRAEFLSLRKPILQMAVGLVLFTVISAGYFIHWIIPGIPLAASFALAAVLSPTDAVAVAGSTKGIKMPARLMHLLEGEALLNDASGLVCFRFAIAAAVTGTFSPGAATLTFIEVSVGGLIAGAVIAYLVLRGDKWVEKLIGPHSSARILIFLLLPFAAYLFAEHFHLSGILSAVAAGFMSNWMLQDVREAEARIKSEAILDMVEFTFNGLIFILLGLELPLIWKEIPNIVAKEGFHSSWQLAGFALSITLFLGVLRFVWTWSSLKWSFYRQRRNDGLRKRTPKRLLAATMLSGVRGAVTLAAALSIPLTLSDGTAFPGRNLAILLAAGVIVFSLLAASFGLPLVMHGLEEPPEASIETQRRRARIAAAEAALRMLEQAEKEASQYGDAADGIGAITAKLTDYYRRRIEALSGTDENHYKALTLRNAERQIRLEALRAERAEIKRLIQDRVLDQKAMRPIMNKLDTMEATLQNT